MKRLLVVIAAFVLDVGFLFFIFYMFLDAVHIKDRNEEKKNIQTSFPLTVQFPKD